MVLKLIKKVISLVMALAVVLSLSCCVGDESLIDEIPTETTETTAETLSEEELDELAQNMPEIVFVMSNHLDNTNIIGLYITNTGEVKMFDFREIAPDEIYEIPDVYDRLEEATCSEIEFPSGYSFVMPGAILSENDLTMVPEDELLQYYKLLLQVNEPVVDDYSSSPDKVYITYDWIRGHFRYYGIRNNALGKREFILLGGGGENEYGAEYDYIPEDPIIYELMDVLEYFTVFWYSRLSFPS